MCLTNKCFRCQFLLGIINRCLKTTIRAHIFFFALIPGFLFLSSAIADPTDVSSDCHISRSSPVVQTNVLFSTYYEMKKASGGDALQGHVTATRIYDPAAPGQRGSFVLGGVGGN